MTKFGNDAECASSAHANAWMTNGRQQFWQHCRAPLDVLVIGGGITGAGVLLAAAQRGLRAALIEQKDFAWGSSSRSSKLVHGGLRYLKQGRFGLTRSALRARNALLQDYPDLVNERRFYLPFEQRPAPGLKLGLALYDALSGRHSRERVDTAGWQRQFPTLDSARRRGAFSYLDAATDDCKLVLRVLQQAASLGALSCNYAAASALLEQHGRVVGVAASDALDGQQYELQAKIVVNATGAWSALQPAALPALTMRPLRGSHLVLPFHKLPLSAAIACPHPQDQRPVYALPWAGAILFGTTDVDHHDALEHEPHIAASEYDYLMSALSRLFPEICLRESELLSSCAGVRPTFQDGANRPSDASREHVIRESAGWLGIAGGKLTTFKTMAADILKRIERQLRLPPTPPLPLPALISTDETQPHYLLASSDSELRWRHALTQEAVQHLDDLMLRRTRIGLVCQDGGLSLLQQRQDSICSALGWDPPRWQQELTRYRQIRQRYYAAQAFRPELNPIN